MTEHVEGTCPASGSTEACRAECDSPPRECLEAGMRHAEVDRIVDGISDDERKPVFIERLAIMLRHGILSAREVRQIVERRMSPRLIAFPPETKVELELSPILRDYDPPELNVPETEALLYNGAITEVEGVISQIRGEGYEPDAILTHGQAVVRAPAGEEVRRGDAVIIDEAGMVRPADGERPIGVALGGGMMRLGDAFSGTQYGSIMMPAHASMAFGGPWGLGARGLRDQIRGVPGRYQYNERFPKEVIEKAMKLLEKFMNAEQYTAFMGGADIELENKVKDHRLIINRVGIFKLLKGARGEGIVMTSGSVRSYKYPLGDEIAVFLDWFRHRTVELIERWRCGTYGIVEDGKQR